VTNLKFFTGATNLWIAASCWEGKVVFFTVPAFSGTPFSANYQNSIK